MALHVADPETDRLVRLLAKAKGKTLTGTVREAVRQEYLSELRKLPFAERIRGLQDWIDAVSKSGGLPADKAFYDELSGEDELTGPS